MGKCEFVGILSPSQEVQTPPVDSQATGKVEVILKGTTLILSGCFRNLSSPYVAAHIHEGAAGVNGPVLFELVARLKAEQLSGRFSECDNRFTLTQEQIDLLKAGELYVNIHTEQFVDGELRSQLVRKCTKQFTAVLLGANEVPPVETEASGTIFATLKCRTLQLSGQFSNLSAPLFPVGGTPVHLHLGFADTNGPVVFPLVVVADEDQLGGVLVAADNTFQLTCEQVNVLKAGGYYVNVHSENFELGEIRGNLNRLH